jgi:hypothetical protein
MHIREFLGELGHRGILEVDKQANMESLAANPLGIIKTARKIIGVLANAHCQKLFSSLD